MHSFVSAGLSPHVHVTPNNIISEGLGDHRKLLLTGSDITSEEKEEGICYQEHAVMINTCNYQTTCVAT